MRAIGPLLLLALLPLSGCLRFDFVPEADGDLTADGAVGGVTETSSGSADSAGTDSPDDSTTDETVTTGAGDPSAEDGSSDADTGGSTSESDETATGADTTTDTGIEVCDPKCADKECGPDGCGGNCGACFGAATCLESGQCVCSQTASTACWLNVVYYADCNGFYTTKKQDCGADACNGGACVCAPQCSGKQCGSDGCGGTCGSCGSNLECNASGVCVGVMVSVPAGAFQRGCNSAVDSECESDESPYKTITLSAFKIDKTEVTVAAYKACVDAGQCSAANTSGFCNWNVSGRESHPINCVDWAQANAYCAWAGKRLPTEAEWEKAARGTDARKYPWGNGAINCARANYAPDPGANSYCVRGTAAVGSYPSGASPYGALDMVGNVWEWVADWYDSGYYATSPTTDPQGPGSGQYRVLRGGSWGSNPALARASDRNGYNPGNLSVGFRCAQ
jgi:formylglycine-generating enzyme